MTYVIAAVCLAYLVGHLVAAILKDRKGNEMPSDTEDQE